MSRPARTARLLVLLAGWVWALPARSISIDTFDTAQSVSLRTGLSDTQAAVTTGAASLGGTRDVVVTRDRTSLGTVTLDVDGSEPGLAVLSDPHFAAADWSLRYDGSLDSVPLHYSGLGGLDLTDAGNSDRLRIIVQANSLLGVGVLVTSSLDAQSFASAIIPASGSFVDFDVPFSAFAASGTNPADFAHAGSVIVSFGFLSTLDNPDLPLVARIESLATVPEPSTAVLLTAGLALSTGSRRRFARSA